MQETPGLATITVWASEPATKLESGQQAPERLPSVEGAEPSVADSPVQETVQIQTPIEDPVGENEVISPVPFIPVVPVVSSPSVETQETKEQEPGHSTCERCQLDCFIALVESMDEPSICQGAMKTPEAKEWHQACMEEITAHKKNRSWTLMHLVQGCKAIRS